MKGIGPAVAEVEFEERPNEPFLFFAADKTDPGAYDLPLDLAFADVMNTAGLILSPKNVTNNGSEENGDLSRWMTFYEAILITAGSTLFTTGAKRLKNETWLPSPNYH